MGCLTTTTVASGLLIALFARSTLAVPTGVQAVKPRQVVSITPSTSILPEVVEHGPLDDTALAELVTKLTGKPLEARSELQTRQTTSKSGAFLTYLNGQNLPGATPECPSFNFEGPITGIQASLGTSTIRNLVLKSISGTTTDLKGGPNVASPAPGVFDFNANERITEFIVLEGDLNSILGFSFKTDAGRSYKAISQLNGVDNTGTQVSLPVGSGIIARIQGTQCLNEGASSSFFGAFGIDFLDEVSSIAITDISYSGFTNNIAPSGPSSTFSVGSQILDNRNSSVQQQMSLLTTRATTKQTTIDTGFTWKVGNSVSVKAETSIPFIAKSEVSTTVNWEVGKSQSESELTSSTITNAATFQLNCPAKKFCVGSAAFQTFKLDVNIEATYTAETTSGSSFTWKQKGTYKGSDSLAMKLTVDEADSPI